MNNHTPSLAHLETRLAKLERESREWGHPSATCAGPDQGKCARLKRPKNGYRLRTRAETFPSASVSPSSNSRVTSSYPVRACVISWSSVPAKVSRDRS